MNIYFVLQFISILPIEYLLYLAPVQ